VARAIEEPPQGGRFGLRGLPLEEQRALSDEKRALRSALEEIERDAVKVAESLDPDAPQAADQLRSAFRELRSNEVSERLSFAEELIREGSAPFALAGEDTVTRSLEQLGEQVREASNRVAAGGQRAGSNESPRTDARQLARELEQLRRGLERAGQAAGEAAAQGSPAAAAAGQAGSGGSAAQGTDADPLERAFGAAAARTRELREPLERAGVNPEAIAALLRASQRSSLGRPLEAREVALRAGLEDAELALRQQIEREEGREPLQPGAERVPQQLERAAVIEYYRSLSAGGSDSRSAQDSGLR